MLHALCGLPAAAAAAVLPQQPNEAQVESQALYRAHEGQVVFVGHLGDGASLVSVDSLGQVRPRVRGPCLASEECGQVGAECM